MLKRRTFVCLLFLAVLGLAHGSGRANHEPVAGTPYYFAGQLLIASPEIRDPRFRKSVIYMVKHGAAGAHGIIINRIIRERPVASVMEGFGLNPGDARGNLKLYYGGPVNPRGAFVLHSGDYKGARSRAIDDAISFTTDISILRAIALGKGPRRVLLALGYAGWGAGQLEDEIERGDWSLSQATQELVFGGGNVWERVIDSSKVPL